MWLLCKNCSLCWRNTRQHQRLILILWTTVSTVTCISSTYALLISSCPWHLLRNHIYLVLRSLQTICHLTTTTTTTMDQVIDQTLTLTMTMTLTLTLITVSTGYNWLSPLMIEGSPDSSNGLKALNVTLSDVPEDLSVSYTLWINAGKGSKILLKREMHPTCSSGRMRRACASWFRCQTWGFWEMWRRDGIQYIWCWSTSNNSDRFICLSDLML